MIVLVEDEPDQRLALRLALEQAGYPVREATHGEEALALLQERAARFVITDIFMPETDGLELIGRVRQEFPQTKIIAISGGGRRVKSDYIASAQVAGADAALRKPFQVSELLSILHRLSG